MNDYPQLDLTEEQLWRARLEDERSAEEEARQYAEAYPNPEPERNVPMPSINDVYGGKKGLKAADLKGRAHLLDIDEVKSFKFNDGEKLILRFQGKEKELVLNKTNAQAIAEKLGDDYTHWGGNQIEVYPDKTQFNGERVDCIRVRFPIPSASSDDEIPF